MGKIIIATKNKAKLQEYEQLLEPLSYDIFSLFDFQMEAIEETGSTFLENAMLKANAVRKITREMVLADDSGLIVNALNGAPGIHSKRFSDTAEDYDNNIKLLKLMEHAYDRTARFVTVIVIVMKDGTVKHFKGELDGYIHTNIEGSQGFGYDPVFIPLGYTKTLASLGVSEKHQISHRARCLKKVLAFLENLTS